MYVNILCYKMGLEKYITFCILLVGVDFGQFRGINQAVFHTFVLDCWKTISQPADVGQV